MTVKKPTYREAARTASINALLSGKSMSGKQRRRYMRATEIPLDVVRTEAKFEPLRLSQRFDQRPIDRLGVWLRRVGRRLVVVERGLEDAMVIGNSRIVDMLSVKRDQFTEIREALILSIRNRIERATTKPN